jgi:A/G-specific adenine glycosylase
VSVFNESCLALQKKKIDQLPVKSKKLKVRNRYFNYLVVSDDNDTITKKRTSKGFGKTYMNFLNRNRDTKSFDYIVERIEKDFFVNDIVDSVLEYNEKSIIHKLSHQHLHIKFWKVSINGVVKKCTDATT